MTYQQIKTLKPEEFKRLCGVRPETFQEMVEVARQHSQQKKKLGRPSRIRFGRPNIVNARILARVPNLLPYREKLGN